MATVIRAAKQSAQEQPLQTRPGVTYKRKKTSCETFRGADRTIVEGADVFAPPGLAQLLVEQAPSDPAGLHSRGKKCALARFRADTLGKRASSFDRFPLCLGWRSRRRCSDFLFRLFWLTRFFRR